MKNPCLYLLLLTVFCFASLYAAGGRKISGVVKDVSGSPIPFVNVVIESTVIGTTTKLDGSYLIVNAPLGNHILTVEAVGYKHERKEIEIVEGKTTRVDIIVTEQPTSTDEVIVYGESPISAASSNQISSLDFELRPKNSAQDLLKMVPGLVIAQHAGGGKAEQIYMRGFDADHGTDVNISVDGIPVNMVSHGHGQGYADLHFVMPEVLSGLEVYKGPYFAQFGDFGTAGTVKFNTHDAIEKSSIGVEVGSFDMKRIVGLLNVPLNSDATNGYLAAEYLYNNSYFIQPQNFKRYNLFGKIHSQLNEKQSLSAWASGFGSKWNASGQIPERAIREGIINRFGSIDPSEGGETDRQNINVVFKEISSSALFLAQSYYTHYTFDLFSNFTFFKNDSIHGDEIEQTDRRSMYGGRVEYSLDGTLGSFPISTLMGSSLRYDDIQNGLWHTYRRSMLEPRADANISETNVAMYLQQEYQFTELLKLQLGLRADYFSFRLHDVLHENTPGDISGNVHQTIVSPKVNFTISPRRGIDVFLNFGTGFHSNDARAIVTNQSGVTLPRAVGSEIGLRISHDYRFTFTTACWLLDLEHELVYSGDEGTTEESGSTRRVGVDLGVRSQINSWLWADADVTISHGRFTQEPEGNNFIPLAPTFTSTGGLTARLHNGIDVSLRYRDVGDRPANEDNSVIALGYFVMDAGVSYHVSNYKVSIVSENIFNVDWNEAQFDTESRLQNEPLPISELHFTPGTPRNIRVMVGYEF